MKVAIIVPVLMAASLAASAQEQTPRPLLQIIKKNEPKKNAVRPQAKLLAVTAAGKIYALPQDNMPCLVPNKSLTVTMPNAAPLVLPGNEIPNSLQIKPVVPAKLSLGPVPVPKRPLFNQRQSSRCGQHPACNTPAI